MKIVIPSEYLTAEDVGDGGKVTFLDAGKEVKNRFNPSKTGYQFRVRTPKGDEKKVTLNKRSLVWMMKHYTDDSEKWIGKEVAVYPVKQMVSNSMKSVLYFGAVPDDGNSPEEGVEEEEVNVEDIPF